jgi:hypothetical protein
MTVNKSQSQSFLQALLDTSIESFGHGQSYVALSRIRFYNRIRFIMNESNLIQREGKDIPTLLNCVYPSVILNIDDSDNENDSDDDESYLFQFMTSRFENETKFNEHKFCDIDSNVEPDERSVNMNSDSDYDSISNLNNSDDDD